jgi:hypothetical protein
MTDRDKNEEAARPLNQSVSSGRIDQEEADVIKRFFASKPTQGWPASNLQRRMQSSGG